MKVFAHVFLLFIAFVSLVACASPSSTTNRYKLVVAKNGLHRVTATDLRAVGIDVEKIDATTLRLYHADQEIAIHVQGTSNRLIIDFYAQASDSPYSALNVYWLTWGGQLGRRMRDVYASALTWTPTTSFSDVFRLAPVRLYAPQPVKSGPSWFWQSLIAPATTTIPITLTAVIPEQARVRLNVWGNSEDAIKPNHHARVLFNDTIVADDSWSGRGEYWLDVSIPEKTIHIGENTLQLVLPGDTGAIADALLLRSIEVAYARRLVAQDDVLEFSGGRGTYRVEGFSNEVIELYDITNPDEPNRIVNPNIASGTVTFSVDDFALRRWLAISSSAQRLVSQIVPMLTTNLRSTANQADYIIISYRDFVNALQPLVEWRAKHGLKTIVVTTDQIYDEFNFGNESPLALRVFLDYVQREWSKPAPRFVLLVGKASYDYRDYLKGTNKNLLSTILVDTLNSAQVASDNQFVAAGRTRNPFAGELKVGREDDRENGFLRQSSIADLHPTVAIGRIPAKSAEQISQTVSKIIRYESSVFDADWRKRAIFIADDKSPEFVDMANELVGRLPSSIQAEKIFLADKSRNTRAELIARWNAGASMLTYVGHGSVDLWSAKSFFGSDNLAEIKNGERLPILFTPTCLNGFFYHPFADSLAEQFLFKSDGGIIAGIVPTGVSFSSAQSELMYAIFVELFEHRSATLGEAFTRAKQKLDADSPELREVIETFVLLGDPALEPRIER